MMTEWPAWSNRHSAQIGDKHYIGSVCARNHKYKNTNGSLRLLHNGYCVECVKHNSNKNSKKYSKDRHAVSEALREIYDGKTSQYNGVSYCRSNNKWQASICVNKNGYKKVHKIGYFDKEGQAAAAYNAYAPVSGAQRYILNNGDLNEDTIGDEIKAEVAESIKRGRYKKTIIYRKSEIKGLNWSPKDNQWIVRLYYNHGLVYMGWFKPHAFSEAVEAVKKARKIINWVKVEDKNKKRQFKLEYNQNTKTFISKFPSKQLSNGNKWLWHPVFLKIVDEYESLRPKA